MPRNRALPVTTLPLSPEEDRHRRMFRYALMMSIRVVCIVLLVVIPWPWALIPGIGAVFLPYFAVLVANATSGSVRQVERPEPQETSIMRLGEEPWEEELRRRDAERDASDEPR